MQIENKLSTKINDVIEKNEENLDSKTIQLNEKTDANNNRQLLWVDRYRPMNFINLLSDEVKPLQNFQQGVGGRGGNNKGAKGL